MAAPIKSGLSYFNCECIFDDKIELLMAEFGTKGLGILLLLWQKVYRNGYFCEWNDDVALLFSKKIGESDNVVSEVIACCLRRGIFDRGMFDKRKILTSRGIQKRYLEICLKARRKDICFEKEYLLINVPDNLVNVRINEVNSYINSQRKEKESKGKKSKVYIPAALPDELVPQWEAFCEMRTKIKQPLTQRAADMAVNKLQSLAPDNVNKQGEILDQSTFNCWKGLFELKDEGGGNGGGNYKDFKPSRR